MNPPESVLVTGATGTLGSLITAALLETTDLAVVAPVRGHHASDAVAQTVAHHLSHGSIPNESQWRPRLHQVALPDGADDPTRDDPLHQLDELARTLGVTEVVHAAGCLSYFDEPLLRAVNIELTQRFVHAASRWGVKRFTHVSTAFSSGFAEGPIAEELHDDPTHDPTSYTESKREGEYIVANSGLPYLILRPSVVIGHSGDGRYRGPQYGFYQLLSGVERFLLTEWHPEVHYVAPAGGTAPFLHQDALQTGFLAAREHLPDGSIVHLTSRTGPSFRDVVETMIHRYVRPDIANLYDHLTDIPMKEIPANQQAFLRLAAINIEISSRPWQFDTTTLDGLVDSGAGFVDASLESVIRCQDAYLDGSPHMRRYRDTYAHRFPMASIVKYKHS